MYLHVIQVCIPVRVHVVYNSKMRDVYHLCCLLLRFHLQNLNKQSRLYQQGMVPFFRIVPGKSNWDRLRDSVDWQVKYARVHLVLVAYVVYIYICIHSCTCTCCIAPPYKATCVYITLVAFMDEVPTVVSWR